MPPSQPLQARSGRCHRKKHIEVGFEAFVGLHSGIKLPDDRERTRNRLSWAESFAGRPVFWVQTPGRCSFRMFCTVDRLTPTMVATFLSLKPLSMFASMQSLILVEVGCISVESLEHKAKSK